MAGAKNAKTKSVLFRGESGRERQHGQRGGTAADGGQLRGPVRRVVPERSGDAELCAQDDGQEGGDSGYGQGGIEVRSSYILLSVVLPFFALLVLL